MKKLLRLLLSVSEFKTKLLRKAVEEEEHQQEFPRDVIKVVMFFDGRILSLPSPLFDHDPSAWGIVLADELRTIINMEANRGKQDVFGPILDVFHRELDTVAFLHLKRQ